MLVIALATGGCAKKVDAEVAGKQLTESFAKAEAPVKQEVARVNAALQAGNYQQAVATMNQVVQVQAVDAGQKKAVDALVLQVRNATAKDPRLATPQLHKAMSDLILKVHGEP
jgi:predicted oxidoreductase